MANKKKDVYRPKPMTEGKKAVIQGCQIPNHPYSYIRLN